MSQEQNPNDAEQQAQAVIDAIDALPTLPELCFYVGCLTTCDDPGRRMHITTQITGVLVSDLDFPREAAELNDEQRKVAEAMLIATFTPGPEPIVLLLGLLTEYVNNREAEAVANDA